MKDTAYMTTDEINEDLQLYRTSIVDKIVKPDRSMFKELDFLERQWEQYSRVRNPLARELEHLMLYMYHGGK